MKRFDRNTALSLLLALIALAIVLRITPPMVSDVVELKLAKNATAIARIDQSRNIKHRRTLAVDRLDLSHRQQLRHPKLGRIGYGEHFFVDIEHEFEVLEGGNYRFLVGSDDGFVLRIDGEELCRFDGDRPYRENVCPVRLEAGTHQFSLSYFQGGGHAGLRVRYRQVGASDSPFFGEDSRWMRF